MTNEILKEGVMGRRRYQQEVLGEFVRSKSRFWALLWERQAGKSTTLADFALYEMLSRANHTVVYGSASLLLSQEITLKAAVRASQTVQQLVESEAARLKEFAETAQSILDLPAESVEHPLPAVAALLKTRNKRTAGRLSRPLVLYKHSARVSWAAKEDLSGVLANAEGTKGTQETQGVVEFKTYDASTGKEIIGGSGANAKRISADGFAELFSQQRLEFRVYYDRTSYSRTKVIAPNVATARSWSGTVLLDEVAFIRNFRELMTALLPVITTDKQFKLILSTTPPEFDDTHYSFELLAPPAGLKFEPNAAGNWYTSESKIRVHRADAFDTALAGKKIFDLKSGDEISPAEAFNRAPNKDGHRIAHWLTWMLGGSAACDLLRLRTAQERGAAGSSGGPSCQNFHINSDADMVPALNWLAQSFGQNGQNEGRNQKFYSGHSVNSVKIGVGFDVATTTKGKSNPSVISLMEERGPEWVVRARFIWKTNDPAIANERLAAILDTLIRCGIRPRALAQDATNERYYAEQNRKIFRSRVPVILVVASQAVDKPGLDKPTNFKEYLSNQLVAKLDDNNLTLPPDDYTRVDYRLVMKDRGKFVCEPNDQGMHGDCFDADKLAGHALTDVSSRRTIVPPVHYVPRPSTLGG
jgi:hypothetical protein